MSANAFGDESIKIFLQYQKSMYNNIHIISNTLKFDKNGVWELTSKDGLRTVRGPSFKVFDAQRIHPHGKTGFQMNFETLNKNGDVISNVHADIKL